MRRSYWLIGFLLVSAIIPATVYSQEDHEPPHLIAHRGGIVDENRAENSLAAIQEAISRDYWMIEIDLRESLDGEIILHHDNTFERYYDDPGSVTEMTWDEISRLNSNIDGTRPLLFEEVVEMASGSINLMLDIKGDNFSDSAYPRVEQILKRHNMLSSTYLLGQDRVQAYFTEGETFHSIGYEELMEAADAGEDVSKRFLFELGSFLDEEIIRNARECGVEVVAAINEFRYVQAGEDTWQGAKKDIERLLSLGVTHYQIDSMYDPLFAGR